MHFCVERVEPEVQGFLTVQVKIPKFLQSYNELFHETVQRFAARTRCKLAPDSEGKPFGHCGVLKGGGAVVFLIHSFQPGPTTGSAGDTKAYPKTVL